MLEVIFRTNRKHILICGASMNNYLKQRGTHTIWENAQQLCKDILSLPFSEHLQCASMHADKLQKNLENSEILHENFRQKINAR